MRDYIRMIGQCKQAVGARAAALASLNEAARSLASKRERHEKLRGRSSKDEVVGQAASEVREAESVHSIAKREYETVAARVDAEMARFQREKLADFKQISSTRKGSSRHGEISSHISRASPTPRRRETRAPTRPSTTSPLWSRPHQPRLAVLPPPRPRQPARHKRKQALQPRSAALLVAAAPQRCAFSRRLRCSAVDPEDVGAIGIGYGVVGVAGRSLLGRYDGAAPHAGVACGACSVSSGAESMQLCLGGRWKA
eukprot:scaffold4779_cov116-Isochrysis_galbana.AAC.16